MAQLYAIFRNEYIGNKDTLNKLNDILGKNVKIQIINNKMNESNKINKSPAFVFSNINTVAFKCETVAHIK